MQPSPHPPASDQSDPRSPGDPQAFVSQLIRSFPQSRLFSAKDILRTHPFLASHRSCVIDLAYEEFCRLREAGSGIHPTDFARRYRDVEQSLHRVIEFDQILQDHPSFIESVPEDQWPESGQSFCGCTLVELIGRGMLSRVFVARQERLGNRRVVAKICARGEQEASLLGRLNHPAIAAVFSIDTHPVNGLSMICMPYLTRATLHHVSECLHSAEGAREIGLGAVQTAVDFINADDPELPRQTPLTGPEAPIDLVDLFLKWGIDIGEALETAHRNEVLHCDVKPGNVLILPDLSVQLLDFNLALSTASGPRILGGTMPYMASEQLLEIIRQSTVPGETSESGGSNSATAATDVFGLCATLWHVLSGEPPFGVSVDCQDRITAARTLLERHRTGIDAVAVAKVSAIVPAEVVAILQQGLQFDAACRPQTAGGLATTLRAIRAARRSTLSPPATGGSQIFADPPSNRRRWIPAIAVLTLVIGFGAWSLVNSRTPRVESLWGEARTLVAANRMTEAETTLKKLLEQDSSHRLAGLLLGRIMVSQSRYTDALAVLQPLTESADSSEAKFLSLYCQSVQLLPPVELRASATTNPRQHSAAQRPRESTDPLAEQARRRDAWDRMIADWLSLAEESELGVLATINAAVMNFETGDFREAEFLLSRLPPDHHVPPSEQRILRCLRLRRFLQGQGPLPEADARTLRQAAYASLGRYELWTLIMLLANPRAIPAESAAESAPATPAELRTVLDFAVGTRIEGFAIRGLLTEAAVRANSSLSEDLARMVLSPPVDIENHLSALLVIPPFS